MLQTNVTKNIFPRFQFRPKQVDDVTTKIETSITL